jgi:hypothetical protein
VSAPIIAAYDPFRRDVELALAAGALTGAPLIVASPFERRVLVDASTAAPA